MVLYLIFFCFAPYSESLFLLVSIGAVERARAGQPWQAGFLGALAMLTRSAGILVLIPLGWEVLRRSECFRRVPARLLLRAPRWLVGNDAFARKLADEFFGKFAATIGGPPSAAAVAGVASASGPVPTAPPPSAAAQRGYRHWMVIGVGAAVLILIFLANR